MMRYPLTIRDWFRFRVIGNRWAFRRVAKADFSLALCALAILAGYGIVGRLDYEDALISEAQAQAARAERMTAEVALCMEGRAVWKSADGKTATVCRKAEEIPL